MNLGQSSESKRNATGNGTGTGTSSVNGRRLNKKANKVKGREMLVKIFYSLQSPRFGSAPSPAPSAPTPTPSTSAASPDFFSVLDPSLSSQSTALPSAPPPPPNESSNAATNYSCFARLARPVQVQVIRGKKSSNDKSSEERAQFGKITLKTLLSAVCISRPELVMDPAKDFSVSAVDAYESWKNQPLQSSAVASSSSSSAVAQASSHGTGSNAGAYDVVEGKGMLSWTMAEKKEGMTMVCGRITGGSPEGDSRRSKRRKGEDGNKVELEDNESDSGEETEETLEIWLQLIERDAFTPGDFLKTLRAYDTPAHKLQSELSDLHSSPPKATRPDTAPFPSSSTGSTSRSQLSGTTTAGDPIKRRRPTQERQSLPLSASTTALPLAPPSAFANLPTSYLSSSQPASSMPAAGPSSGPQASAETPDLLAIFAQLVSSSTASSSSTNPLDSSLDVPQNQEALKNLAKLCGLPVPEEALPLPPPPSTQALTSTSGPVPQPSSRPPKTLASSSTSNSDPANAARKKLEHFSAIAASELRGQGKNNPRDVNGCSNCKRKKSTVWREGLDSNGVNTSVCNACGTFYNKNGYHRSKGGPDQSAPTSSRQIPSSSTASLSRPKPGRPLSGRLTATCESDLAKRKMRKRLPNGSPDSSSGSRIFGSGIVPPLSPSKHIGPRSPSLSFGFGGSTSRANGTRAPGIMSSPGRSPRLRYRHGGASQGIAATSPLRAPADAFAQDGGFNFAALFGGHASPSPKRRTLPSNFTSTGGAANAAAAGGGTGDNEKGVPNYLLTASPGTALDRILNETNIGGLSGLGEAMQVDGNPTNSTADSNPFNFFLQPGSPSLKREHKENERPRASTVEPSSATIDAPETDADSFESVLSSLRRDFNNRLSSNALTAPSSPVPSSPCVQPRTSTATPGSKGKAPLSSGRAPPSIFDSFTDGLVTGIFLEDTKEGGGNGRTPHSDSDAWTPNDGDDNEDQTVTFDSLLHGGGDSRNDGNGNGSRSSRRGKKQYSDTYDLSHLLVPSQTNGTSTATKRAAFVPSHLVPASDATDFDLGSLPPSSPPQLPSESFPTPSDFDGVTPGTEGGDNDERERSIREEQERMTIEAVAEKVASEPNEEARAMVMALLQSVGSGKDAGGGSAVEIPGVAGGDKITLDRSTVDKLLSLISAKPSTPSSSTTTQPHAATSTSTSTSIAPSSNILTTHVAPSNSQESPDLSQIDFFNAFGASSSHEQHELHHSSQMNGLYSDLFANTQF
ncbi:uncharacterized protein JCM6883_006932 [Sporobolomyces salmoneus]|uniref:uncharacterized protein n=1 Tax=Sporobolomyces salmoneus TaxID=183962 RepID=UPI00317EFB56